jgi:hypothetical protein
MAILSIHASDIRTHTYTKKILVNIEGEVEPNTIRVGA